jgi:hypothetical protein
MKKQMKLLSRSYWHRKYIKFLEAVHSKDLVFEKTKELYHTMTGKWLDYSNPTDINQKLMWLTRYWRHPLKTKCADKYRVREYVKEVGLERILIPLVGVWDRADEIPFDDLPDRFVLKCNHGSGFNVICLDKSTLDWEETKKVLNDWLDTDYSALLYEIHYKDVPRKIVCEQYIGVDGIAPTEYQFWCINGVPESILACRKNLDQTYDAVSYSLTWERLFDRIGEDETVSLEKPACGLEPLIEYAKTLAEPFPFIRVDFYVVGTTIYLAEMTFTPSANLLSNYKQSFLDRLGDKLVLPEKLL